MNVPVGRRLLTYICVNKKMVEAVFVTYAMLAILAVIAVLCLGNFIWFGVKECRGSGVPGGGEESDKDVEEPMDWQ